uniref:FAD/NAD(P)-binding domain-containing protein n=1 Tax=Arcella intermedia TaxID=1963864 RepID=A0A6B2L151_9EUKA
METTAEKLKQVTVHRPLTARVESDSSVFAIVGAGPAGVAAVDALRTGGYTGRILLIERFNTLPYDRTKLSKAIDSQYQKILLKGEDYFKAAGVELILGVEVVSLDVDSKTIVLSNQQTVQYTKALIATGGDPQKLSFIPGHDANNIFTLRTVDDAQRIHSAVDGKDIVIVGSSFIGLEVAAAIVKRAKSVTVVGMETVPFERVLGTQVGTVLKQFHESQGIKFVLNAVAKEFQKSESNNVHTVLLKDDTKLSADIVIIGAGIIPATSFIKGAHIKMEKDRSIVVDKHLQVVGAEGTYAAGDIARYPFEFLNESLVRIEHFGVAMTQGALAAKNMLAKAPQASFTNIPFFWTAQYGKSIRYAGHALQYDQVILDTQGENIDPANPKFVAFYAHQQKIVAVCTMQRDPVAAQVAELMSAKVELLAGEVEEAIKVDKSANKLLEKKMKVTSK